MAAADILDRFVQQAKGAMASSAIPAEIDSNLRALLQGALADMDVVPRDEFDAQVAVLHRTRKRIEALEAEVEKLRAG